MDSETSNLEVFKVKLGCSILRIYLQGKGEQNLSDGLVLAIAMPL